VSWHDEYEGGYDGHDWGRYDGRQLGDDVSTADGYEQAAGELIPLLEGLTERQRLALMLRYGIVGGRALKYPEIGNAMSISTVAAFYLCRKAARHLRSEPARQGK
jgi:DNA-directed RNA polymerase specialized sigma subunit